MKDSFSKDSTMTPPGSLAAILAHPYQIYTKALELATFNDHRYAFFFWNKWTRKLMEKGSMYNPPCLVSLDWHQDLVYPSTMDKKSLRKLNLSNNRLVALYAWAKLNPLNDTHIMAAAYLNLIGDVYVHCRQRVFDDGWDDECIKDRYGNIHTVRKFKQYEDLEAFLVNSKEDSVYFDIDLDFFSINNPLQIGRQGNEYTYLSNMAIQQMLSPGSNLMKWVFQRLEGITIALEPEHTGGLRKAHELFDLIDNLWFEPSLFTTYPDNWEKSTRWKHLRQSNSNR